MTTESARIRAKLSHPLIDGDSHIIEYAPVLMDRKPAMGQLLTREENPG